MSYPVPPPPPRLRPPQSGTILALGILSVVVCGVLGPIAWSMGKTELARIDRGELAMSDRSMVQAGLVCGIVGTCVLALQVLMVLAFVR